jgi:large subunit ribosomal protein L25
MAGGRVRLEVQRRDERGSGVSRRLRATGMVPGVLYGKGEDAQPFAVSERELRRVFTGEHGTHAILDVLVDGKDAPHHAVLKDVQVDPIKSRVMHVDLHEIRLDQVIQVSIAVELVGTPEGVVQGGVLSQVTREVNVEVLPMAVPDRFSIDVSGLAIGDSVRVSALEVPEGVTMLDDPELILANVTVPARVEEPEEAAEAAEGEELEPGAESEAGEATEAEADASGE